MSTYNKLDEKHKISEVAEPLDGYNQPDPLENELVENKHDPEVAEIPELLDGYNQPVPLAPEIAAVPELLDGHNQPDPLDPEIAAVAELLYGYNQPDPLDPEIAAVAELLDGYNQPDPLDDELLENKHDPEIKDRPVSFRFFGTPSSAQGPLVDPDSETLSSQGTCCIIS